MSENKTRRVPLMVKPSVYKQIKDIAKSKNVSVNSLINEWIIEKLQK